MDPRPEKELDKLLATFGPLIIGSTFDLYGILDLDGRVIDVFGKIFDPTAVDPALLSGQRFSETVFWQSSELTPNLLDRAVTEAAADKSARIVLDFRKNADEKVALEVRIVRLENTERLFISGITVNGRQGWLADAEGLEGQMLLAAENASIGLYYWDLDEDRIFATPTCNELFGLGAHGSFTYDDYIQAVHPDDREFVDDLIQTARRKGTKYSDEFRVLYDDGSVDWIWADGRCFLDENKLPNRMMGVVRNVTEQKLAAEELVRVHELERRARNEAVEAIRGKDFFINFVSHELRSPLNTIQGWATILLTKELAEEKRRGAFQAIDRSARLQAKILNDLVDYSRVASGRIRLQYTPTDLVALVLNSFEDQRPDAEAKGLKFKMASDAEVVPFLGDANRLQQVFSNLLSNAIKFTPDDGMVSVNITTGSETVEISVTDTGRGISSASLPVIFNQFSQGDISGANSELGLGLGLSLVKVLVSKHRGNVRAESEGLGKGARFTVVFPLTDSVLLEGPQRPSATVDPVKRLDGIRVYVVEDDADSREVLDLFLTQNGADVIAFDSARSALESMTGRKDRPTSVLISDLGMPDEDGYTLIRKLRALDPAQGGDIPAIALSAFTSDDSKQRAVESGFDRYSTKPFDQDILINDILELADRSRPAS
ncbi:MAG: response regulator [Chloracidobacterium sp.]|nr:response regulator [Chloracidobacterium sp.]